MNITKLQDEFFGTGEVKGMNFQKFASNDSVICYKVTPIDAKCHFEVFKRKLTPLCIDFEKRIYSETDFKESYPKSNDFGIWAWCINDEQKAMLKFNELSHEKDN